VSSEFLEKKFWKMDLPMEKNFWILVAYGNGKLPMDGKLPLRQNFWNRNSGL